MQQYRYLKELLQLPKVPSMRVDKYTLENADLLMIVTVTLTVFNLLGVLHPLTVFVVGILIPFYLLSLDIYQPKYYFHVLAVLLCLRLETSTLSFLDGCFIVSLWHPNIRMADKIVAWIIGMLKPKKTTVLDKINQKVDKFLD